MVNTQFHNFYGRSFGRVLYFILIKDTGRWLLWMILKTAGQYRQITARGSPLMATRSISVHTRRYEAGYGIYSSTHYPITLFASLLRWLWCGLTRYGTLTCCTYHVQQSPCHCLCYQTKDTAAANILSLSMYRTEGIKYFFLVAGRIVLILWSQWVPNTTYRKVWYTANTNKLEEASATKGPWAKSDSWVAHLLDVSEGHIIHVAIARNRNSSIVT